jgi:hypothetical protein
MSAKPKKLALMLTMVVIFLNLTVANMKVVDANGTGGKIDLFTQKEPYSGKGPNAPSDAFGPEEIVILYALVTYSEAAVQNLLVAFHVQTPGGAFFDLTARTNEDGIATVNFTVTTPPINVSEGEIFGEWHVLADALIDGNMFQDSLIFKVDWIVKLISVRIIDENLTYRSIFGIGGDVGLEITLRNIAMTIKKTALAIVIQDVLNVPVNSSTICDFDVQPNEKLIFLYCKLHLPKWTHIGEATVFISAFTAPVNEGGVPYCPAISTEFFAALTKPITIAFHDAAVINVIPSATSVELGQPLSISVVVRNEGTEVESFNVSAYFGSVLIGTLEAASLIPYSKVTLEFTLYTSLFDAGNYTITASIPQLVNEADLTDNVFVDGMIEIKPKMPTIIHDIAIVDIKTSSISLYIGDLLHINVSVVNKGTETETFNVETYYDSSLIETLMVNDLAPNTKVTLNFMWNTSSVHEGFYQVSAYAPLSGDINVLDNTFVDGVVQVKVKPPPTVKWYYLTVSTDPIDIVPISGEGWYEEGTNVTLTAPEYVSASKDVRYRFSCWDVDGTLELYNPILVTMDVNHTVTAHYILQYYLTVNSPYGTSSGAGWYDTGSTAYSRLDISILDHENGTRRIFTNWGGDASGTNHSQSNPIVMDNPKTAIANWKTQYYLTVRVDPPGITTISGEGWYDEPVNVTISAPMVSNYNFEYWDVNGVPQGSGVNSITVHMDAPHSIIAHYTQIQIIKYTLTITTTEGGTTDPEPGTYNYTAGATVQVTATSNANYVFDHWELDNIDVGSANSYTVTMDKNHTLKAIFSLSPAGWFVPGWFYWLLPLLSILIIILLIIFFYNRKRREKTEEAFYSGWTAWYYCYDLLGKSKKFKM